MTQKTVRNSSSLEGLKTRILNLFFVKRPSLISCGLRKPSRELTACEVTFAIRHSSVHWQKQEEKMIECPHGI